MPSFTNNSAILSRFLGKYEGGPNLKARALLKKISPVAWRHILLNGHYTFRDGAAVHRPRCVVAALDLA
jgi:hypothetical protein